jgi:RNA polymerase sigma factor (sigma-70 family)
MRAGELTADQAVALRTTMGRVEASVARFSRNDAADIVQEAMTRALRHGVECDAEPWLKVVARRIATDKSRRAREIATEQDELDRGARSRAPSPEDIVVANDSVGVIRKAINALPPRYRDALLTYSKDQSHEDVADQFGISPNATWSLLCRARARLRQELDRVGYAFGMFGIRIQRWVSDLPTAAAITCVAIGATLVGPTAASAPVVRPVERSKAVVSVSLPKKAAPVVSHASVTVTKPAVEKVKKTVKKVVEPVAVASYELKACGPTGEALPLGAKVSILEDERRSLVADLVSQLPEQLRVLENRSC